MRTGGAFRGHSRPTVMRAALTVVAAALVILTASGCASSSDEPSGSIPPNNLISRAEADAHPPGSVEHAFLEFWSDLQFQSWVEVASYYDPAFRDFVGTASIIGAKKINGSTYPNLKPAIVKVMTGQGLTTIKYTLQFIDGTKELTSVSWRKVGGNWQIVYDSRLDAELSQYAENRVEIEQNGVLPTEANQISPEAIQAGSVAAQSQARFLQQESNLTNP